MFRVPSELMLTGSIIGVACVEPLCIQGCGCGLMGIDCNRNREAMVLVCNGIEIFVCWPQAIFNSLNKASWCPGKRQWYSLSDKFRLILRKVKIQANFVDEVLLQVWLLVSQ